MRTDGRPPGSDGPPWHSASVSGWHRRCSRGCSVGHWTSTRPTCSPSSRRAFASSSPAEPRTPGTTTFHGGPRCRMGRSLWLPFALPVLAHSDLRLLTLAGYLIVICACCFAIAVPSGGPAVDAVARRGRPHTPARRAPRHPRLLSDCPHPCVLACAVRLLPSSTGGTLDGCGRDPRRARFGANTHGLPRTGLSDRRVSQAEADARGALCGWGDCGWTLRPLHSPEREGGRVLDGTAPIRRRSRDSCGRRAVFSRLMG